MHWAQEHIRKDVCELKSKLVSNTNNNNTQIESGETKVK